MRGPGIADPLGFDTEKGERMIHLAVVLQDAEYAAREAAAPEAAAFAGGAATAILWTALILLSVLVVAFYYLVIEPDRFGGK